MDRNISLEHIRNLPHEQMRVWERRVTLAERRFAGIDYCAELTVGQPWRMQRVGNIATLSYRFLSAILIGLAGFRCKNASNPLAQNGATILCSAPDKLPIDPEA